MSERERYVVLSTLLLAISALGIHSRVHSPLALTSTVAGGVLLSPLVPVYVRWNTRSGHLRHRKGSGGKVAGLAVGLARQPFLNALLVVLLAMGLGGVATSFVFDRWWPTASGKDQPEFVRFRAAGVVT